MELIAARPLADRAVTFELATRVGPEAAARVGAAQARLAGLLEAGELPGALELSRAFCSITLHYDPLEARQADLVARVRAALADTDPAAPEGGFELMVDDQRTKLSITPRVYSGDALVELGHHRIGL